MISASQAIPSDWALRCGGGALTLGYDVATTEKKSSNPSSLTVMEKLEGIHWERLVVRWKSEDPEAAYQMIASILDARPANDWRRLCIDATSERYHAQNTRKKFRGRLQVVLVVSSETIDWEKEKFSYKTLLGDLYVSAFEDGIIALPPEPFILGDHRLVKKQGGGYTTEVDEDGNHGDTFDSGKLAYWGHVLKGGPVRAQAVRVGNYGANDPLRARPGVIGPIGRMTGRPHWTLST